MTTGNGPLTDSPEGLEDGTDLDEYPGLKQVSRLATLVRDIPWFASIGEYLDEDEIDWAQAYLADLGFPHADIVSVTNWEEAEEAARNPEWNTDWWEAEEQQRVYLGDEACQAAPEDLVMVALTHVTSSASDVVHGAAAVAAARFGTGDEALIRAAAGAATQACHQAALVLAAEATDDHPFALKFRLFEQGRWPLGVIGNSFHLF